MSLVNNTQLTQISGVKTHQFIGACGNIPYDQLLECLPCSICQIICLDNEVFIPSNKSESLRRKPNKETYKTFCQKCKQKSECYPLNKFKSICEYLKNDSVFDDLIFTLDSKCSLQKGEICSQAIKGLRSVLVYLNDEFKKSIKTNNNKRRNSNSSTSSESDEKNIDKTESPISENCEVKIEADPHKDDLLMENKYITAFDDGLKDKELWVTSLYRIINDNKDEKIEHCEKDCSCSHNKISSESNKCAINNTLARVSSEMKPFYPKSNTRNDSPPTYDITRHHQIDVGSWVCKECYRLNYPERTSCMYCKMPKVRFVSVSRRLGIDESDGKTGWICDMCYNWNFKGRTICKRCGMNKNDVAYQLVEG